MRCVSSRSSVPNVSCTAEGCSNPVEAHVYSTQMLCPTHMISTALPPDIQPERPLSEEEMVEDLLEMRKALTDG